MNSDQIKGSGTPDEVPVPDQTGKMIKSHGGSMVGIYAVLIAVCIFVGAVQLRGVAAHLDIEGRARAKLREIGSAQLAYQGRNNMKFYGSFNALRDGGHFSHDETMDTLIRNYSLAWTVTNPSTGRGCLGCGIGNNTFTVVAYPNPRLRDLRTFGISEDQVLRIYNPSNPSNKYMGEKDPHVQSWDQVP